MSSAAERSDITYIGLCINEAKKEAVKSGAEYFTPLHLLTFILRVPNDFIRKCITDLNMASSNPNDGLADGQAEQKQSWDDTFVVTVDESGPEPEEPEPDKKAMIADLTERVKKINEQLLCKIFGQDNAVSVFTSGYFQAELLALTDKDRKRPAATFLFVGPPGVGKTFLAEQAANAKATVRATKSSLRCF
jgi:ATP-dependent Clp protease ATP-binding subunit ClpA